MIENIHHGAYLKKSEVIQDLNVTVIDAIRDIYDRGKRQGLFREDLDPIDIHFTMSALCFFSVSNRATFSNIFKRDMSSAEALKQRRASIVETVARYVMR